MNEQQRKRIVILGGGFAGVYTAMHLEKALRRRDDLEILLINKENYFVFQPMLAEVVSGSIGMLDTVSPIRRMLPRTDLHVREVESIDIENQTITTTPGLHPHPNVVHYDHLVLALGNVTDFRKQLLTFVVAGGGFSGVEVAAELNDFVRKVIRNYRHVDPAEVRVVLLHSQDRILPELDEKLALYAQKILARRGVEILLNTKLEAATGDEAILADSTRISTKTLISTVP